MHNVPGASPRLGDFTTTPRMITIGLLAIAIGVVSASVAKIITDRESLILESSNP